MYQYTPIDTLITGSEDAAKKNITKYGVQVYVDSVCDMVDSDFYIDPADEKGIEIFRSFCLQMAAHYKTLKP